LVFSVFKTLFFPVFSILENGTRFFSIKDLSSFFFSRQEKRLFFLLFPFS